MKRFLTLIFIAIVGFTVNDVQKEYVTLDWGEVNIPHNEADSEVVLSFEGAAFLNTELPIPVYSRFFSLY